MLVCCLVPLAGLGVALLFGVPLGSLGILALLVVCPLSHLLMMRGAGHKAGHSETSSGQTISQGMRNNQTKSQ